MKRGLYRSSDKAKRDEMKQGWYWLANDVDEPSLVFYYKNPDTGSFGFGFNISDGCGFLPEHDLIDSSSVIQADVQAPGEMSRVDALYGFAAWLTSREERTVMSSRDDAAPIAELVNTFIKANGLADVSTQWPDNLIIPVD